MNFQRIDVSELEVTQIESRQNEILDHNQNLENNKRDCKSRRKCKQDGRITTTATATATPYQFTSILC